MRRAAAAALALLVLSGCAQSEGPTGRTPAETATPGPAESPSGPAPGEDEAEPVASIEIVIEGDRVEPNGQRVRVRAGEPILLAVTSDRAAELHVHSSPEQVVEIAPGESLARFTIPRPGVVDVEEHESGVVVLRLEVR